MPAPTRSCRFAMLPAIASMVALGLMLTIMPTTAHSATEHTLPVYCLAPDGIVALPVTRDGDPVANSPYWFVGLHSDPTEDVSSFLSYREGEDFGIHPSGFGSMTEEQDLTFDALGFAGSTTAESNTGDIRFLGIAFRNEHSLYVQDDIPAFHMYIGPSAQIITSRCAGIFHDAFGVQQEASEIYWTPAYQISDGTDPNVKPRFLLSH